MEFTSTVEFAHAARQLNRTVVRLGLMAPSFRCPPRLVGIDRTIRRRPREGAASSSAVVSIRVKQRQRAAVVSDMIEGVVVANDLQPPDADRVRNELWQLMAVHVVAIDSSAIERGAA